MNKIYNLKSRLSISFLKGLMILSVLLAGNALKAQFLTDNHFNEIWFIGQDYEGTGIDNLWNRTTPKSEGLSFTVDLFGVMSLYKDYTYIHNILKFSSPLGNVGEIIGVASVTGSYYGLTLQGNYAQNVNRSDIFIAPDGKVGIGPNNKTPNGALHVIGADNDGLTAALTIDSPNSTQRMLLDGNEIETVNTGLYLQLNSDFNISMVSGGGGVGIGLEGTADPLEKLHISGNLRLDSGMFLSKEAMIFRTAASGSDNNMVIFENNAEVETMRIHKDGNVGIGTSAPTHKLEVDGTVKASSFVSSASSFPDYVFDASYQIIPLDELNSYVKSHKHLPNMPSEREVVENGFDMTDVMIKSVENIETIYLHLISLNEKMEALQKENAELKALLNK